MIALKHITKTYKGNKQDVIALKDVTLTFKKGDKVVIKGASGAGKSTLLNIIGLLDLQYDGEYSFNGNILQTKKKKEMRKIRNQSFSFIFQEYELIENDSVYENVALPLLYRKKGHKEIKKEVACILEKVGLSDKIDEKVSHLSGGQRQRIAIARALISNPTIVLADEPTGSLDQKNAEEMYELLCSLMNEQTILIVATHNSYFDHYANRRFALENGVCNEIQHNKQ